MIRLPQTATRLTALTRGEWVLLLRSAIWLAGADVILRIGFLRRAAWRRLVNRPLEARGGTAADVRRARVYARWLDVASRHHVVNPRCLHRSIVLQHWLRREGQPSELRIGVWKNGGALQAHSWVELLGVNVSDPPSDVPSVYAVMSHEDAHGRGRATDIPREILSERHVLARAGGTDARRR